MWRRESVSVICRENEKERGKERKVSVCAFEYNINPNKGSGEGDLLLGRKRGKRTKGREMIRLFFSPAQCKSKTCHNGRE